LNFDKEENKREERLGFAKFLKLENVLLTNVKCQTFNNPFYGPAIPLQRFLGFKQSKFAALRLKREGC